MTTNPILSAPAVREARDAVTLEMAYGSDMQGWVAALDAYAAAILAEVRRRVEAVPALSMAFTSDDPRFPSSTSKLLDRAAVLRVLDGGEA